MTSVASKGTSLETQGSEGDAPGSLPESPRLHGSVATFSTASRASSLGGWDSAARLPSRAASHRGLSLDGVVVEGRQVEDWPAEELGYATSGAPSEASGEMRRPCWPASVYRCSCVPWPAHHWLLPLASLHCRLSLAFALHQAINLSTVSPHPITLPTASPRPLSRSQHGCERAPAAPAAARAAHHLAHPHHQPRPAGAWVGWGGAYTWPGERQCVPGQLGVQHSVQHGDQHGL